MKYVRRSNLERGELHVQRGDHAQTLGQFQQAKGKWPKGIRPLVIARRVIAADCCAQGEGHMASHARRVGFAAFGAVLGAAPVSLSETPFSVVEAGIPQIQEAMRTGRLTSHQLVQMYLDRLGVYRKVLNP